jgi:hypothetical protein
MGRCENERADFNQKADPPLLPSEFGDSRPNSIDLFSPTVTRSCHSQFPTCFAAGRRFRPVRVRVKFRVSRLTTQHTDSFCCRNNFSTMLFGPLGPSLAPYVRSSRTLSKWLKPVASWYANLSGYRRVGLVYDDLRAYPPRPCQTPCTTTTHFHHVLAQAAPNAHSSLSFPSRRGASRRPKGMCCLR